MLDVAYSFPGSGVEDEELVEQLGLETPLFLQDIGFELKPPQLLAVQFAAQHPRFLLSFEKGMGKTIAYMLAAHNSGAKKWLIVCGRNAMLTQALHLEKYFPEKRAVFIRGGQTSLRKALWETEADVYICTGPTFLTDMGYRMQSTKTKKMSARIAPSWCDRPPHMVWDEWHKMLRNRGTSMHQLMKDIDPQHLILSSGSAGGKGPQSQWTALNVCDRKAFSSYWKYVYAFCLIQETHFGKQIVAPKDVEGWRRHVGPYVFHRKKDLKYYPPKTRQALPVEMEPWQQKIHDELKKDLLTILPTDAILVAPNVLAATHKIRQLMICPKFLDPELAWGAGLTGILEDVQESELSHFVVSTPYTGPVDLIAEYFNAHKIKSYIIKGGMEMEDVRKAIDTWTQTGGVIIQSIMFAESYELPAAANMYMLGYLHDPEQNSQAEDRIHRDIRVTPHPVNIYYVKHKGSYDENIVEAMSMHADNIHHLMNRPISEIFQ